MQFCIIDDLSCQMRLCFFTAAQIAQGAQPMLFRWVRQLVQSACNIISHFHILLLNSSTFRATPCVTVRIPREGNASYTRNSISYVASRRPSGENLFSNFEQKSPANLGKQPERGRPRTDDKRCKSKVNLVQVLGVAAHAFLCIADLHE